MCGTRACPMHAFVMQSRFAEAHGEGGSGWSSAHGCSACTLRAVGRSKFYFVHVGVSRAIHTLDRTSKNRTVLYCRVACLQAPTTLQDVDHVVRLRIEDHVIPAIYIPLFPKPCRM